MNYEIKVIYALYFFLLLTFIYFKSDKFFSFQQDASKVKNGIKN